MENISEKKEDKYKRGDRFIVRIDKLLHGRNSFGEFTDYIMNALPSKSGEITAKDGCVVTEGWLDKCNLIAPVYRMMKGKDPLDSDVYCPICGNTQSGYYGEEPPDIVTCYGCGSYLSTVNAPSSRVAYARKR